MARRRIYGKWDIPKTVKKIVSGVCDDYERRKKLISAPNENERTLTRCTELNAIVDDALAEIEVGARKVILRDVAENRGYYRSGLQVILSKNAYYRRKNKLVHDIASAMALI